MKSAKYWVDMLVTFAQDPTNEEMMKMVDGAQQDARAAGVQDGLKLALKQIGGCASVAVERIRALIEAD